MALSAKMAKYLVKERAALKGKDLGKADLDQLEMQTMKKTELQELATGRGAKAKAAKQEIERRQFNKDYGDFGEGGEAMTGPKQRELKKFYSGEKRFEELDSKAMGFGDEFRKGGMAKKKVAAKKPAVKKPAVKKPIKRGK